MPRNFFNMRSSPGTSSICEEFVQIGYISTRTSTTLAPNPLPATTPSAELCLSIMVVSNLEGAFNLNTDVICVFLGKDGAVNIGEDEAIHLRLDVGEDGELRTECWKVQFHHFLIELLWQELDIGLECLGHKQNPQ